MIKRSKMGSLANWADALNQRGMFARPSSEEKPIVDRSTAHEFAVACNGLYGILITDIGDGPDPPDIVARIEGRLIGIEMTELLKREVREAEARNPEYSYARRFEESQWTREEFECRVNERLDEKAQKYASRSYDCVVDVLVVHSDEAWLDWKSVQDWLAEMTFEPRRAFLSAYLLLTHSPQYPHPHWPLFRLYGQMDARK